MRAIGDQLGLAELEQKRAAVRLPVCKEVLCIEAQSAGCQLHLSDCVLDILVSEI
jgi:hypothetical protein